MISEQHQGKQKQNPDAFLGGIIHYDSSLEGNWAQQGTTISRSQYMSTLYNEKIMKNCRKCFPSLQDSIVLHIRQFNEDKIIHCSANGLLLKQIVIKSYSIFVQAISPQLILIVYQKFQPSQCEIIQWNLNDHTEIRISYIKNSYNYLSSLQIFTSSKLFYVLEQQIVSYELKANPRLRKVESVIVHCYKYPLMKNDTKLFRSKKKVQALWFLSQNRYEKMDDNSKIAIFASENRQQQGLKIIVHQVQSSQSKWEILIFKPPLENHQKLTKLSILNVYQACNIQNQIYFSTKMEMKDNKAFNQYIWSYRIDHYRAPKFHIDEDHSVRFLGMPNSEVNREMPVYYIDIKNERILAITKNKNSFSNTIAYQKDREVLWTLQEFDRWDKKLQRIMVQEITYLQYPINQISTFMLLEKIPQCDEDLLQQIAQYRQQNIQS